MEDFIFIPNLKRPFIQPRNTFEGHPKLLIIVRTVFEVMSDVLRTVELLERFVNRESLVEVIRLGYAIEY